jgi:hypothetical protein
MTGKGQGESVTATPGPARDVGERLREIEDRLERLLASGWRHAGAEAAALAGEAEALAGLGLAELAGRLRHVAEAGTAGAALPAIALALAACRLFRARVAADDAPAGEWGPLAAPRRRAGVLAYGRAPDKLLPIGRMAVGDGEAWACVQLRGTLAHEWFLVDPVAPPPERTGPRSWGHAGEPPWLRGLLGGYLRWQARYPVGASGEVQRCVLEGGAPAEMDEAETRLLTGVLAAVANRAPKDGMTVLGGRGGLRLRLLEPSEVDTYVWPDPAAARAFAGAGPGTVCALTWVDGAAIKPLALISPPGFMKQAALIHLVPGCPATPLAPG